MKNNTSIMKMFILLFLGIIALITGFLAVKEVPAPTQTITKTLDIQSRL